MKITKFFAIASAIVGLAMMTSACKEDTEQADSRFWRDSTAPADNPLDPSGKKGGIGDFDPNGGFGENDDPNTPGKFGDDLLAEDNDYLNGFGKKLKNQPNCESVYFDLDMFELSPAEAPKLDVVVEFLNSNPGTGVVVEGNCDDRGTKDYNRGLGERRALTVKQALMEKGIDESRIAQISYGEDKPAVQGEGEVVWARNRRDDFVFVLLNKKP